MSAQSTKRTWQGGNGQKCLFIVIGLMLTLCETPLLASPASEARAHARKAMAEYRAEHPLCEICGFAGSLLCQINVHHKIPVAVDPARAADKTIMISLCRWCHVCFGHAGDRACRVYVANFDDVLKTMRKEPIP